MEDGGDGPGDNSVAFEVPGQPNIFVSLPFVGMIPSPCDLCRHDMNTVSNYSLQRSSECFAFKTGKVFNFEAFVY